MSDSVRYKLYIIMEYKKELRKCETKKKNHSLDTKQNNEEKRPD